MSQPFTIKAWPFVDHESTTNHSYTSLLWPFIYYERNNTHMRFSIRPLLFTLERDPNQQFKLMFFFYSFYLNVQFQVNTTFFLLPLLLYVHLNKVAQTTRVAVFGGIVFYGSYGANYAKRLILPLLFYSKDETVGAHRHLFQVWFPLYWKRKSNHRNFTMVLPVFFRYVDSTFTIFQIWPFYGTQFRTSGTAYKEHSVLYPFFRIRTNSDGELTIHLLWPLFKLTKKANKFSMRLLPFLWIRKGDTFSRGYILLFYWEQIQNQKLTIGIFPFIHVKRGLGSNKYHTIFILFLYFWRETATDCIRSIGTILYVSWWDKNSRNPDIVGHVMWIVPLFFYSRDIDNYIVVVPLALAGAQKKTMKTVIVQIPFFVYLRDESIVDPIRIIWATLYLYYSEINVTTLHVILPGMIIIRTQVGAALNLMDVWVLAPFIRKYYCKKRNSVENRTLVFPLFYYRSDTSDTSQVQKRKLLITLPVLVDYKQYKNSNNTGLNVLSPLFGFIRSNEKKALWIFPIFVTYKSKELDLLTIPLILFTRIMRADIYRVSKVTIWPLAIFAEFEGFDTRTDQRSFTIKKYRVAGYGLFISGETYSKEWMCIGCCYLRVYQKTENELSIYASLFLLPPWYMRKGTPEKAYLRMLLPFFVLYYPKDSDGSLYLLPPLIRIRLNNPFVTTYTIFPLFRYKRDVEYGKLDLRILFFFKFALFRLRKKRSHGIKSLHRDTFRIHLFPFVFWERKQWNTPPNGRSEIAGFARGPSLSTIAVQPVNLLTEKFISSNPQTTLTLFGYAVGYGLFSITIDKMYYATQVYLFPLFHIESQRGSFFMGVDQSTEYVYRRCIDPKTDDTYSLALLWLVHPRISLLSYTFKMEEKSELLHETTFYIMALFFIKTKNIITNPNSDHSSYRNERTWSLFWLIHPYVSLVYSYKYFSLEQQYSSLFYIFPLFRVEVDKSLSKGGKTFRCFSLFWMIHRFATLFYFADQSKEVQQKKIIAVELQDQSTIDTTDHITIDIIQAEEKLVNTIEYDFWTYSPILFYVERVETQFKLSIFWFFVRQLSFIRYSKEPGVEVKLVLFPLFKYGRRSGEWSKWCLFPLVPIKYSYIVSVLAREKTVRSRGMKSISGTEDKGARAQDVDIRFIYRLIRYQIKNGRRQLEVNPFFNSEKDPSGFSEWNFVGGCFGQRRQKSRDKECRCCCFFYF
jgi:hypothetical protein